MAPASHLRESKREQGLPAADRYPVLCPISGDIHSPIYNSHRIIRPWRHHLDTQRGFSLWCHIRNHICQYRGHHRGNPCIPVFQIPDRRLGPKETHGEAGPLQQRTGSQWLWLSPDAAVYPSFSILSDQYICRIDQNIPEDIYLDNLCRHITRLLCLCLCRKPAHPYRVPQGYPVRQDHSGLCIAGNFCHPACHHRTYQEEAVNLLPIS